LKKSHSGYGQQKPGDLSTMEEQHGNPAENQKESSEKATQSSRNTIRVRSLNDDELHQEMTGEKKKPGEDQSVVTKKLDKEKKKSEAETKKKEADNKKLEEETKKKEADKKKLEAAKKKKEAEKKKLDKERKKLADERKKVDEERKKIHEELKKL